MRTIAEIKKEIGDRYVADANIRQRYGIAEGETFDNVFSVVSIESIIFYVCAFSIWLLEQMFDTHKKEVQEDLDARLPHTAQWYRNQVLNFEYRNTKPIAYCAVNDNDNKLQIKIAAGAEGNRTVVDQDSASALASWLSQNKDAGTKIVIVNENNDTISVSVDVYYDALYLRPSEQVVETAIRQYVQNLDFDGILTANNLTNAILAVTGVKLADVTSCMVKYADNVPVSLGVQRIATSGYWTVSDVQVNYISYSPTNIE